MKLKALVVTLLMTSLVLVNSVRAEKPQLKILCESASQSSTCSESNNKPSANIELASSKDLPVVGEGDWRKAKNIPWSVPVVIKDPFDGDYLAVLDRNYSDNILNGDKSGVISNWSRNYIRTYVYQENQTCGFFTCSSRSTTAEAKTLEIKVGDQVFRLKGEDGNFPVNSELATALRNAPLGEAVMRITLEGSGATIVNDIGSKTVQAWKTVYQDASSSAVEPTANPL